MRCSSSIIDFMGLSIDDESVMPGIAAIGLCAAESVRAESRRDAGAIFIPAIDVSRDDVLYDFNFLRDFEGLGGEVLSFGAQFRPGIFETFVARFVVRMHAFGDHDEDLLFAFGCAV